MSNPTATRRPVAIGVMVASAALSIVVRLIPYTMRPPNFAANGSLGLFGGARVPLWLSAPLQFAALVISDLLLWKLSGWSPFNPAVYLCFGVYLLLGRALLKDTRSPSRVALVSLIGSAQFFLVTNFFAWYGDGTMATPLYEASFTGLLTCYTAALPFLVYTVAGELGFSAVLFGAEAWLLSLVEETKQVTAEVAS